MWRYLVLLFGVFIFFGICDLAVEAYRMWEASKEPKNRRLSPKEREQRWGPT